MTSFPLHRSDRPRTRARLMVAAAIVLVLLLALAPTAAAQNKRFFWERVDVEITALENGDLRVVEEQTINFSGGDFTFGFRTIPVGPAGGNDGIVDLQVAEGSTLFRPANAGQPNTFSTERQGNEIVVTWYFAPTQGRHTYTFAYTVKGGIHVDENGDQVFWMAIPADHPARIDKSSVTVQLPPGVTPQRFTGTDDLLTAAYINGDESREVDIFVADDGQRITYVTNRALAAGETLEVRVQFPHGILPLATPEWQLAEQRGDVLRLIFFVLGAALLLGGPLGVLLLWYGRGRDPQVVAYAEYVAEPPDALPPAVVGTLIDEKADLHDVVATLLDLANRGYLTLAEKDGDHVVAKTEKAQTDLRSFEKRFLRALLGKKSTRKLSALRYKFSSHLGAIQTELYKELVDAGLFDRPPNSTRSRYGALGVFGIILAVLLGVGGPIAAGSDAVGVGLICLAVPLGLTGVLMLITSRFMPAKTAAGALAAARWKAFKTYLEDIEKYTNLAEATDIFDRYLPYAVAFGLDHRWIAKFAAVPETPVPPWYNPLPRPAGAGDVGRGGGRARRAPTGEGGVPTLQDFSDTLSGGLQSMSGSLTTMLTSATTIMASTRPSSSGSGGFSGGGFSGGFSGGGSSGGGSMGFG